MRPRRWTTNGRSAATAGRPSGGTTSVAASPGVLEVAAIFYSLIETANAVDAMAYLKQALDTVPRAAPSPCRTSPRRRTERSGSRDHARSAPRTRRGAPLKRHNNVWALAVPLLARVGQRMTKLWPDASQACSLTTLATGLPPPSCSRSGGGGSCGECGYSPKTAARRRWMPAYSRDEPESCRDLPHHHDSNSPRHIL